MFFSHPIALAFSISLLNYPLAVSYPSCIFQIPAVLLPTTIALNFFSLRLLLNTFMHKLFLINCPPFPNATSCLLLFYNTVLRTLLHLAHFCLMIYYLLLYLWSFLRNSLSTVISLAGLEVVSQPVELGSATTFTLLVDQGTDAFVFIKFGYDNIVELSWFAGQDTYQPVTIVYETPGKFDVTVWARNSNSAVIASTTAIVLLPVSGHVTVSRNAFPIIFMHSNICTSVVVHRHIYSHSHALHIQRYHTSST